MLKANHYYPYLLVLVITFNILNIPLLEKTKNTYTDNSSWYKSYNKLYDTSNRLIPSYWDHKKTNDASLLLISHFIIQELLNQYINHNYNYPKLRKNINNIVKL